MSQAHVAEDKLVQRIAAGPGKAGIVVADIDERGVALDCMQYYVARDSAEIVVVDAGCEQVQRTVPVCRLWARQAVGGGKRQCLMQSRQYSCVAEEITRMLTILVF